MNWAHFRAFFWLRWRLRINHLKRAGFTNKLLLGALGAGAVLTAVGMFAAFFVVGYVPLAEAPPTMLMYVWDGVMLAFLFFWTAGLVAELQRSDALSLDKLLHLPVSLSGAFVINYLGSLLSLSLLVFLPSGLGLSLGLAASRGPAMLLLIPLGATFLLMITALTYQLQGWLAALMVNQRRRRTILAMVTVTFILLAQLPNLLNTFGHNWMEEPIAQQADGRDELNQLFKQKKITRGQYRRKWEAYQRQQLGKAAQAKQEMYNRWARTTWLANLLFPPGWLPLGALGSAQGRLLPPMLALLGMTTIAMLSLWRAYRTTLRLYTGTFTAGRKLPAAAAPRPSPAIRSHALERRLLWFSEPTSAVALATFRSLTRAPEARMMLLSFGIMLIFMATGVGRVASELSASRPLLAFGAMGFILMGMLQLTGNQFGLDRTGFQTLVLSGVPRQNILLGKNLAPAPFALCIGLLAASILQWVAPTGLDYLLAMPPLFVSMYLLNCLLANWMSILAPVRIPAGALRGAKPTALTVVLQMLFMLVLFPLAMAPLLLPMAAKVIAQHLNWATGWPICSLLTIAQLGAVVGIYRFVIACQGRHLQAREQAILATVRMQPE